MCQAGCEGIALCTQPAARRSAVQLLIACLQPLCCLLLNVACCCAAAGASAHSANDTCTRLAPAPHLKVILKVTSGLSLR